MVVWGSYLDDQIERLVDNPHIVNAKKGRKMTPICGIKRGETLLCSNVVIRYLVHHNKYIGKSYQT